MTKLAPLPISPKPITTIEMAAHLYPDDGTEECYGELKDELTGEIERVRIVRKVDKVAE